MSEVYPGVTLPDLRLYRTTRQVVAGFDRFDGLGELLLTWAPGYDVVVAQLLQECNPSLDRELADLVLPNALLILRDECGDRPLFSQQAVVVMAGLKASRDLVLVSKDLAEGGLNEGLRLLVGQTLDVAFVKPVARPILGIVPKMVHSESVQACDDFARARQLLFRSMCARSRAMIVLIG